MSSEEEKKFSALLSFCAETSEIVRQTEVIKYTRFKW